jgi:hypothetical protein
MQYTNFFRYINLLLIIIFLGASSSLQAQGTHYADTLSLGNGIVYTWVKIDTQGTPEEIGITLTEQVFVNLPVTAQEFSMELPDVASDSLFTHILFDWNPAGHPPTGVYDVPHFDIHFYIVPSSVRQAVIPGPDPVMPDPQFVAPDYIPDSNPPMAVPNMGSHWIDSTSSEWNGGDFTRTFIYGYYQGEMFFVEPMITLAYFQTHPSSTEIIKQPASFQKSGFYPTTYAIEYDPVNQEFQVYLQDFVFRSGITSLADNMVDLPETFSLAQNYPNPFNPVTIIEFNLPHSGYTSLKIFNLLGQEVAELVSDNLSSGTHTYQFDAGNLASGVYIYRLETEGFAEMKKMILMK